MSSDLNSTPTSTRRWRIPVIGNSVATMVHDRNSGREFGLIDDGIYRYQELERELERGWSPDVLIVNFAWPKAEIEPWIASLR